MKSRRSFRKLYLFHKILHRKSPSYVFKSIPENKNPYASWSALNNQILFFNVKTNFLKNSFFTEFITEWNNLDVSIRNSSSCHIFKDLILKFIRLFRPEPNRISSTQNFEGLKLLTRMRLGLSHLADHKFRHNFQDCLNPICSCGQEIETTSHFLLHCLNYRCARKTFFEKINLIDSNISQQSDLSMTNDLLYGNEKLKDDKNNALLTSTIELIQSTERFKYQLFQS